MNLETPSQTPRKAFTFIVIGMALVSSCAAAYLYWPAGSVKALASKSDVDASMVVAVVNGNSILDSELAAGGLTNAVSRAQMVDDYVNKLLMASDMERNIPSDVVGRIQRARRDILSDAWVHNQADIIKAGLTEQDFQDVYKKEIKDELFARYKLSFIMSPTADADAEGVKKEWTTLKTGANEEWFVMGAIPYQMGALVATMKKGDVTQSPIAVREGYIRLRVDDIQVGKRPTFAEAKSKITDVLIGRKLQANLQALRGKADIRIK